MCGDDSCNTLEPVEKMLRDAKLSKSQVLKVVLEGDLTRIFKVLQLLLVFFNGKESDQEAAGPVTAGLVAAFAWWGDNRRCEDCIGVTRRLLNRLGCVSTLSKDLWI
uniref:Uncharacterized protein n=1 Tax=Peronospora matthiolae TaxID=2874970 RepID=A0AAV1VFY5_9STRA